MIKIPCPLDLAFPDNDARFLNAADLRRFCGYGVDLEHEWATSIAATVLLMAEKWDDPEICLHHAIFVEGPNGKIFFQMEFALMLFLNCKVITNNIVKMQAYMSITNKLAQCKHLPDDQQIAAIEELLELPIDRVIALMQPENTSDPDIPF